jgi:hypothetical protein
LLENLVKLVGGFAPLVWMLLGIGLRNIIG